MTQNNTRKIDPGQITVWLCVMFIAGMAWYKYQASNIQNKHNNFKPMKNLSRYENALVYAAHDSVLDARTARYDSLVLDYNNAFKDMLGKRTGIFSIYRNFERTNVHPKYSKQIGAKNLNQYSRYLDRYEQDSITPIYHKVHNNRVLPYIRNNINSK